MVTFISKSRNFTSSELKLGTSVTIKCEIAFDHRMNIRVIWKHFKLQQDGSDNILLDEVIIL